MVTPQYCFRYLCFVRNAFGGTPTLAKETLSEAEIDAGVATSDILYDSPHARHHGSNLSTGTKSLR